MGRKSWFLWDGSVESRYVWISKLLWRLALQCLKYLAGIAIAWWCFTTLFLFINWIWESKAIYQSPFILDSWKKRGRIPFQVWCGRENATILHSSLFASNLRRKRLFRKPGALVDCLATYSPEEERKKKSGVVERGKPSVCIGIKLA